MLCDGALGGFVMGCGVGVTEDNCASVGVGVARTISVYVVISGLLWADTFGGEKISIVEEAV